MQYISFDLNKKGFDQRGQTKLGFYIETFMIKMLVEPTIWTVTLKIEASKYVL